MANYYNRDGEPVTPLQWARDFENSESRRVDFTEIGDVEISTVFLGLNHQFGDGPPLIYESMVFGGSLDGECQRYTTETQARAGHTAMVAKVKAASQ